MSEQINPKKLYILAAIVVIASGLIAWGLVSLYRADDAWQDEETYTEEDNLQDEGITEAEANAPEIAPPIQNNKSSVSNQKNKTADAPLNPASGR